MFESWKTGGCRSANVGLRYVYLCIAMCIAVTGQASEYGAVVRGKIVQDGEAVPNMQVALEDLSGQQYPSVFTDRGGMFVFTGITPGKYKVVVGRGSQAAKTNIVANEGLTNVPPIEISRDVTSTTSRFKITPSSLAPGSVSTEEARAFVRRHMAATENGDLDAVMATYAPEVDYYDEGVKSRDYIRKSQKTYIDRYPQRKFMLGAIDIIREDASESSNTVLVRFPFRYTLSVAGKGNKTGNGSQLWIIRKDGDQLHIIDCKENVIRD